MPSGKPLSVDGRYNRHLANVARLVNAHNVRLGIAGDTQNFPTYRVPVGGHGPPHVVWHLVNGGGGACLPRTHLIPPVEHMQLPVRRLREPDDFEGYPTRDDSRRYYNRWWQAHGPAWAVDRDRPP